MANFHGENGKQKPNKGEGQANLSEKVGRHARIIPNVPAENNVYDYAHHKFHGGYDDGAHYPFLPKGFLAASFNNIQQHQANSARYEHAPMGEAPKHQLY